MGRFISLALLGLMGLLLWNSALTAEAVREALRLAATAVIPSLFPFAVLSSLFVSRSGDTTALHRLLGRILGVSPQGVGVFFLGLLGGYPMGARLTGQLVQQGVISREEGSHLLRFVNNAGPAFTIGIAGAILDSARLGLRLYLLHAGTAALLAVISRPRRPFPAGGKSRDAAPLTFVAAVQNSALSCLYIAAFVAFFCALLPLMFALFPAFPPVLAGIWELTAGITVLTPGHGSFIAAAALLGWGGICVHAQTAAVLRGTGIGLAPYLRGKLLHALLSGALAFLLTKI